jgi:2-polyprenyl-3-methyl-5-hydroxy-6-metoxy-1,4-benzoquinol methylase
VLDVWAGVGRDVAGFAALGHQVTAVEATAGLRSRVTTLHPSFASEWLDDSLPDLKRLHDRIGRYDVVMLITVWMHLNQA